MRGPFDDQGQQFSYISPERRVLTQHPLRTAVEASHIMGPAEKPSALRMYLVSRSPP